MNCGLEHAIAIIIIMHWQHLYKCHRVPRALSNNIPMEILRLQMEKRKSQSGGDCLGRLQLHAMRDHRR